MLPGAANSCWPTISPFRQFARFATFAMNTCFALLDDHTADASAPRSRLYTEWHSTLRCDDAAQLPVMLAQMQAALGRGLHAVTLFSYELGARWQQIAPYPAPAPAIPLAQVLLFSRCQRLSTEQVTAWLQQAGPDHDGAPAGIANIRASVGQQAFHDAIARIRAYIEAGDTYQINYTYRLQFDVFGSPVTLYQQLRARQPVPYGALIALPDGSSVLSFSPELFFRHAQGVLRAQPMKGTAPAAPDQAGSDAENQRRATALGNDEKNRAENLMIVDLLRNDLGRVAVSGSVAVPQLFEVRRYGEVLQMTSTVTARLQPHISLHDLLRALFPCGSITGAPKRRAMQIIRELETLPRGLYTGAIGWFDAPAGTDAGTDTDTAGEAIGDFCLSVPIRTLHLQAAQHGVRSGEMGVGAGIVHDSVAADEYAECRLKAAFLTGLNQSLRSSQPLSLFETLYATREHGCRHRDLHLQRLRTSAAYFDFACDVTALHAALTEACAQLPAGVPQRLRLALQHDGVMQIHTAPLPPIAAQVTLCIAADTSDSNDLFLRHKSTRRERYDAAWRLAEQHGAFDMLFFNQHGELTEGGRSNVLLSLDGRWYTPPLTAGVLPGVMRAVLMADPQWAVQERRLTRDDLIRADSIMVCNALRGAVPATIDWDLTL